MAATERIPLLVTRAQKALFTKKAKGLNLTVNEFVRRAVAVYDPSTDDAQLEWMINEVLVAVQQSSLAVDAAMQSWTDTKSQIAAMEALHAARPV